MKIAIISDLHLGAKANTRRGEDPFIQAEEAFERAVELGAQIILVPGDIFDERIPNQEVWSKALRILSKVSERENKGVELIDTIGKSGEDITALPLRGIPVVVIHGNHERRGKGFVDSIEALESAGLVIKLHHNAVILGSAEDQVAIHGMGYVPEGYEKNLIEKWKPSPVENLKNIFMIHQDLGRFRFSDRDEPVLEPNELPKDFDVYISGHVHYRAESEVRDKPLLFPGSTFRTQLLPIESETPKGFYMIDLGEENHDFIELDSTRNFFYEKKEFRDEAPAKVEDWTRKKLKKLLNEKMEIGDRTPLIRFKLVGSLIKGSSRSEIDLKGILSLYEDQAILQIDMVDLDSPDLTEKTQFLRNIREEKISMEERGMKILEDNLKELDYNQMFDSRKLFDLLSTDKVDEAFDFVSEKIKELTNADLGGTNDN